MNIIDLVFPKKCFGCGHTGNYFCSTCVTKLTNSKQLCIECLRPSVDGFTHDGCAKQSSINGFISVFTYSGAIKKSLISLKYKFAFDIANELSGLLIKHIQNLLFIFPKEVIIVPIPLYKNRQNWRGFNQSSLFAKKLAANFKWNYDDTIIVRNVDHTPQAKLHKFERLKNVKNVYEISKKTDVLGKNIIVFDDVVTTGATFREVGKLLKSCGAKTVWGIAVAH